VKVVWRRWLGEGSGAHGSVDKQGVAGGEKSDARAASLQGSGTLDSGRNQSGKQFLSKTQELSHLKVRRFLMKKVRILEGLQPPGAPVSSAVRYAAPHAGPALSMCSDKAPTVHGIKL